MAFYFSLQYKRILRWFEETGFNPYLSFLLLSLVFISFSMLLFYKTQFAKWIYPAVTILLLLKLSEQKRNSFLKIIFEDSLYYQLRIIENCVLASPFLVYLMYENHFLFAVGLFFISLGLAFYRSVDYFQWVVPTPFKKRPFEFIMGFRQSFVLIIMVYFITFQALIVDNFNLGLGTLGALFLVGMSYYLKPEHPYFVRIFADESNEFLKRKMVYSLTSITVITLPVFFSLLIFFPDMILYSIVVQSVGYVFLISVIVAKYSAYPHEMNVPQGILYAISLWFPPLLLIIIPIFYKQSKRNLDNIL